MHNGKGAQTDDLAVTMICDILVTICECADAGGVPQSQSVYKFTYARYKQ